MLEGLSGNQMAVSNAGLERRISGMASPTKKMPLDFVIQKYLLTFKTFTP